MSNAESPNLIPSVVTAASFAPVDVANLKARIDIGEFDTTHDVELVAHIAGATEEFESDTGMVLATRTLRTYAEQMYDGLQLQIRPVASITSLKYYDGSNVQQTLATTVYGFDAAKRQIRLKYQQTWPTTVARWDAWEITYVAGYATTQLVPPLAKSAILMLAAHRFENPDMLQNETTFKRGAYEAIVQKMARASYP